MTNRDIGKLIPKTSEKSSPKLALSGEIIPKASTFGHIIPKIIPKTSGKLENTSFGDDITLVLGMIFPKHNSW